MTIVVSSGKTSGKLGVHFVDIWQIGLAKEIAGPKVGSEFYGFNFVFIVVLDRFK